MISAGTGAILPQREQLQTLPHGTHLGISEKPVASGPGACCESDLVLIFNRFVQQFFAFISKLFLCLEI